MTNGSTDRQAGIIQGLSLVLPTTTSVMGSAILAPNIPQMIDTFQSIPNVEYWVPALVTLPALCIALFSTAAGAVADIIGRRRIMIWAMVIYGFIGMLPIVLQDFWIIFASRVVVGLMEAIILTTSTTLIGDYFNGARRDFWLSMQTTTASTSSIIMFPLGGYVGRFGWQYPFAMYGLCLLLVFLLILYTWEPAETERQEHKPFPWGGLTGIAVTAILVTYGVSRFAGWLTPLIIYGMCLIVMLVIGWNSSGKTVSVTSEQSGASWAGFPWFRLTGICLVSAVAAIMFYLLQIMMARVLGETGITDTFQSGVIIAIVSTGIPIGTIIFSRITRIPVSYLILMIFGLMAIGFWGMAQAPNIQLLMIASFINQVGCGLSLPGMLTWAMRQLTFYQRGRGIGIWTSFFNGGQFVGPAFVTWLSVQFANGAIRPSYNYVAVGAAVMAVCAVIAILSGKGVTRVSHFEDAHAVDDKESEIGAVH